MGQRRFKPKEIIHMPHEATIKSAGGKMTEEVNLSIGAADTPHRSLPDTQNSVYMNGATADPWVRTRRAPSNNITIMIGASQNFLRSFMKPHKSISKSIISMVSPDS